MNKARAGKALFQTRTTQAWGVSYSLGRIPVNMPGAIVNGDGAFARRLYRLTPNRPTSPHYP